MATIIHLMKESTIMSQAQLPLCRLQYRLLCAMRIGLRVCFLCGQYVKCVWANSLSVCRPCQLLRVGLLAIGVKGPAWATPQTPCLAITLMWSWLARMERPCLPQQLHQLKRCVRSGLCAINVAWPGIAGTLFAAMRQVWLVRYIRIGMTDSCRWCTYMCRRSRM